MRRLRPPDLLWPIDPARHIKLRKPAAPYFITLKLNGFDKLLHTFGAMNVKHLLTLPEIRCTKRPRSRKNAKTEAFLKFAACAVDLATPRTVWSAPTAERMSMARSSWLMPVSRSWATSRGTIQAANEEAGSQWKGELR